MILKTEDQKENNKVYLPPPKELALKVELQQKADPVMLIYRTFQALRKERNYKTDRKKKLHSSENGVCGSMMGIKVTEAISGQSRMGCNILHGSIYLGIVFLYN